MVASAPLFAHHGTAASYDQNKVVKVKGIVKEFLWRNPHSSLYLEGKDDSGKTVVYSIEMGSPGQLAKGGYTRNTFKPGDEVTFEMHPSFSNPTSGENLAGNGSVINGKPFNPIRAGSGDN
jgi:hypothetical protein